jgi:hypothetical protein
MTGVGRVDNVIALIVIAAGLTTVALCLLFLVWAVGFLVLSYYFPCPDNLHHALLGFGTGCSGPGIED